MPARRVRSQDLPACGDLEAFCHCFACLAASDRFRHERRKIEEIAVLARIDLWAPVLGARRLAFRRNALQLLPMENTPTEKPHVVIVGAGFGGLEAAKKLACEDVRVTVIDRTNYHLFQPLLYQVATAALSPADIAAPVRSVFSKFKNVEVILAEVQSVDVAAKKVKTADLEFDYDYLILATGARHSYFGHNDWEKLAPGLKSLEDAIELRRRILMAFEYAEKTDDEAARKGAMTFVIIGGGPTGVEMAGAIAEISRHTLAKDFRHIDPSQARVILIEGEPRLLAAFPEDLSQSAQKQLVDLGVDVRTGVRATNLTEAGVQLGDEFIPCRVKIWAAGNNASFVGKTLGVPIDRVGRAVVNDDLTIPGHPEVQVIGDLANFSHQTGEPLPGVSPVAIQQGRHAARNILAMIGRNKAVADLKFMHLSGLPAWLAWLFVHIVFLVGFRNRLLVLFQWAWAYFTFDKGARLITRNFQSEQRPPT